MYEGFAVSEENMVTLSLLFLLTSFGPKQKLLLFLSLMTELHKFISTKEVKYLDTLRESRLQSHPTRQVSSRLPCKEPQNQLVLAK